MELTLIEECLIVFFLWLILVAYLHDYCSLSLHMELALREERLIKCCM